MDLSILHCFYIFLLSNPYFVVWFLTKIGHYKYTFMVSLHTLNKATQLGIKLIINIYISSCNALEIWDSLAASHPLWQYFGRLDVIFVNAWKG